MKLRPESPLGAWLATCLSLYLGVIPACGSKTPSSADDPLAPKSPTPIPNLGPVPPATTLTCSKGTFLTYENFGESFMLNYCAGCHSRHLAGDARHDAPVVANFDRLLDVAIWRLSITQRATGDHPTMPPAGNVTKVDRQALAEWLGCGVPAVTGESRLP